MKPPFGSLKCHTKYFVGCNTALSAISASRARQALVEQGFLQVSARATEDSDENAQQFL